MSRRPLFVTRKFPPSIGGMETLAAGTWRSIAAVRPDARKLSLGGPNRDLVWWLPLTVVRVGVRSALRRLDFVLTGDALTYAALTPVLRLFRIRHATMIMGLDVTYENRLYRSVVRPLLRRAPAVIAISAATAASARAIGVPGERISVLRLGVTAAPGGAGDRIAAGAAVRERLGLAASDVLILTLGRLVRRKGARWFVAEVLPELPSDAHYLVAGDGPERQAIADAALAAGVADRVHLLGQVGDAEREQLMRGADLFVQPNVAVPHDMEGFGLVTIEAALRGTPVVAADLEGIKDAVVDGSTGTLLVSADTAAWVAHLRAAVGAPAALAVLGSQQQAAAARLYGEQAMGSALVDLLGLAAADS